MNVDDKVRVLLVDDDPDIVWGLGRYLTKKGCVVAACGDGAEAVELLEGAEFDAVVTDIQMPEVNGLAVVEWAHRNRPAMRVIVITGFGSRSIAEVVKRKGAALYLEKPVDPDIMFQVIMNRSSRDSFSGVVDEIDLFDYVQLITVTRRQTVLDVRSAEGKAGTLFVDRGTICHAECEELDGEAAFFRCLSFDGGTFTSEPWREPERVSIDRRADHLLMDAARLKDEGANAKRMGGPKSSFPPAALDFDLDRAMSAALGKKE